MKSIRLYLIATILAAMTLLIFLSALHGYRDSFQAAEQLLDKQLMDMAHVLSTLQMPLTPAPAISTHAFSTSTAFQVWQGEQLLSHSSNTPTQPISGLLSGFRDSNFSQYRWRTFVYHNPSTQRWVMTAERLDVRNRLVEKIILESFLPTVLILPVALFMIWLIVGFGLKPLKDMARQLQSKQEHDLSPVVFPELTTELYPLVESTNRLLTRLSDAFEREKRFAADAAHELRTPVSVLKVHLHNLQADLPENHASLMQLTAGVERIAHLIEQMLALYRTAPDQYMASFQLLDLYEIAQDSIAQQYAQFEEKDQQIELLGSSAWLQGDRFSLEALFHNLLGNASKYTPVGGRILATISTSEQKVRLRIEDSGPGVPAEEYARIFDRFYRSQGDRHASGVTGCGLGLSIVQHIAELHQASIVLSASVFDTGLAITLDFVASSRHSEPEGERS